MEGTARKKQKTPDDHYTKHFEALDTVKLDIHLDKYVKTNGDETRSDFFEELEQELPTEAYATAGKEAISRAWTNYVNDLLDNVAALLEKKIGDVSADELLTVDQVGIVNRLRVVSEKIKTFPSRIILVRWDRFKEKHTDIFTRALQELSPPSDQHDNGCDTGILNIKTTVDSIQSRACYISAGSAVNFRHEGVNNRRPPMLYLENRSHPAISSLVYVFNSSSGSGKTVELAGSAATRDCHLAIVLTTLDGYDEDRFGDCDSMESISSDNDKADPESLRRLQQQQKIYGICVVQ